MNRRGRASVKWSLSFICIVVASACGGEAPERGSSTVPAPKELQGLETPPEQLASSCFRLVEPASTHVVGRSLLVRGFGQGLPILIDGVAAPTADDGTGEFRATRYFAEPGVKSVVLTSGARSAAFHVVLVADRNEDQRTESYLRRLQSSDPKELTAAVSKAPTDARLAEAFGIAASSNDIVVATCAAIKLHELGSLRALAALKSRLDPTEDDDPGWYAHATALRLARRVMGESYPRDVPGPGRADRIRSWLADQLECSPSSKSQE